MKVRRSPVVQKKKQIRQKEVYLTTSIYRSITPLEPAKSLPILTSSKFVQFVPPKKVLVVKPPRSLVLQKKTYSPKRGIPCYIYRSIYPFRAPKSLPTLTSSNFVPPKEFPVVKAPRSFVVQKKNIRQKEVYLTTSIVAFTPLEPPNPFLQ